MLEQLGQGDASITTLADRFHMTLTGISKHVGVLERAGLVSTRKVGRVRTCRLSPRRLWAERFAALDAILAGPGAAGQEQNTPDPTRETRR